MSVYVHACAKSCMHVCEFACLLVFEHICLHCTSIYPYCFMCTLTLWESLSYSVLYIHMMHDATTIRIVLQCVSVCKHVRLLLAHTTIMHSNVCYDCL